MTTPNTPQINPAEERRQKIQSFIDDIDSMFDSIYQEKREKYANEFNFDLETE
jgi:hypothetical protein